MGGSCGCLHEAAVAGDLKRVQHVLEIWGGGRINERAYRSGTTALHCAAGNGHSEVVEFLIKKGANVLARITGKQKRTVLHSAVCGGNREVIRLVLNEIKTMKECHAYLDAQDSEGDTPLMWAAELGKFDAAEMLLDHRASPHVRNLKGMTAVDLATENGHERIKELILEKIEGSEIIIVRWNFEFLESD